MQVLTLSHKKLNDICKELLHEVTKSGFQPDLMLGVKSGGEMIAKIMYSQNLFKNCALNFCHPLRTTSLSKKKKNLKFLKILPVFILDILRKLEYKFFFHKKLRSNYIDIVLPENIKEYNNILIIDDAVDSGATLNYIIEILKKFNSKFNIKTAVITVTTKNPFYFPDFYVFNNNTLIRFPWSADAK